MFEVLPVPLGSNPTPGVTVEIYQNMGLDINSSHQVLGQYVLRNIDRKETEQTRILR